MKTNTNAQQLERINLLAAGLLTAAGAHLLLNLLGIPKLLSSSTPGALGILFTALKVCWTFAGIVGAGYVIYNGSYFLNARSIARSRIAARGAMVLPLLGLTGFITVFALVPLGAFTFWLLKQPTWMAPFDDVDVVYTDAEGNDLPEAAAEDSAEAPVDQEEAPATHSETVGV